MFRDVLSSFYLIRSQTIADVDKRKAIKKKSLKHLILICTSELNEFAMLRKHIVGIITSCYIMRIYYICVMWLL